MNPAWLLKPVVFLASFLLFQIELIIAKALLPGFGGSYLVWAACVLFFQVALLLGYGYTHLAARKFAIGRYAPAQAVLVFLPMALFPIRLSALVPDLTLPFVVEIVGLLLRTVGPAFFALSTVSVMAQNLLAASGRPERDDPYFLYGTSNLGSFLGLISYPFLVEPFLDLDTQLLVWEIAFAVLAVAQAVMIFALRRGAAPARAEAEAGQETPLGWRGPARWLLLSAAGSALFLSVTNIITFELASVPLFWMLPLGIFLFTFYLNFKQRPWSPDWLRSPLCLALALAVGVFLLMLAVRLAKFPAWVLLSSHLAVLFVWCMYCQSELARSRPAAARGLTAFYLVLAAGGAAGSALASFVMPLVSNLMLEYLLGFLMAAAAVALAPAAKRWRWGDLAGLAVVVPVVLWPNLRSLLDFKYFHYLDAVAVAVLAVVYLAIHGRPWAVVTSLVAVLITVVGVQHLRLDPLTVEVYKYRNFYGISVVFDRAGKRYLRHGSTTHGVQWLDPSKSRFPLSYYHPTTPVGELLTSRDFKFRDLAVVGLGPGALASYCGKQRTLDYYEIDPDIKRIAMTYFTYLKQAPGEVRVIIGDGRLSLARAPEARYDLIAIDAFNSDAIPVHLLTTEAMTLYFDRLNPGGILLMHISNNAFNLMPMLSANARTLNLYAFAKTFIRPPKSDAESCRWMAFTRDPAAAQRLTEGLQWIDLAQHPPARAVRPWTDRYSNLISAVRTGD